MRKTRIFLLLCAAICSAAAPALGFSLPPAAESALETAVREAHIPVMAVAVVDPDGVVYEQIFGEDADADTPFLLGSLSKSFTALGIMQLEDQGLLRLDDTVSEYLADVPDSLTIRQLLNQTGGYGTYQRPGETLPLEEAGRHIYSNLNYALLARIIEEVSGQVYAAYLQENILLPLGMEHTGAMAADAPHSSLVQGYENWFGLPLPAEPHLPHAADWIQPGAGYISASIRDMARYLQMYLRGGEGILPPESISRMFSESIYVDDDIPYEYGYGWTTIREPLPQTVYRHSGLVETGMTCMYLLPEEQLGLILMADMNDYLVGTDLLDRLGWNLVLSIMGASPGSIQAGEYWQRHTLFNLMYVLLLVPGILSLCLLRHFHRKLSSGAARHPWASAVLCLALGALLPLVPRLFLATPLWVVAAFVPDLHLVLWLAAGLLLAGGAVRLWLLMRCCRFPTRPAPDQQYGRTADSPDQLS